MSEFIRAGDWSLGGGCFYDQRGHVIPTTRFIRGDSDGFLESSSSSSEDYSTSSSTSSEEYSESSSSVPH